MPLIKTPIYNYDHVNINIGYNNYNNYNNCCNCNCNCNNNNNNNNEKSVTNLIIKVSSTTFVTAVFACFVYCVL